jgi:putative PIN family toxin of toxin-antitoxin system
MSTDWPPERASDRVYSQLLGRNVELVPITMRIQACRDSKDDKFLELALNSLADVIVTGDKGQRGFRLRSIPLAA